jgi:hypothetical protein
MSSNTKEYKGSFTNPRRKANKKSLSVSLKEMVPDYSELFENKKSGSNEALK